MVLDGFGWFWVVLGRFGWFRVLVTTALRDGSHDMIKKSISAINLM